MEKTQQQQLALPHAANLLARFRTSSFRGANISSNQSAPAGSQLSAGTFWSSIAALHCCGIQRNYPLLLPYLYKVSSPREQMFLSQLLLHLDYCVEFTMKTSHCEQLSERSPDGKLQVLAESFNVSMKSFLKDTKWKHAKQVIAVQKSLLRFPLANSTSSTVWTRKCCPYERASILVDIYKTCVLVLFLLSPLFQLIVSLLRQSCVNFS